MPFDRQLLARRGRQDDTPRPWAQQFFTQAEPTGLSLGALNDIVAECATLDAAMGMMAQRLAAGEGEDALRRSAQNETAARIGAAHAKAHQPRRPDARR